MSLRKSALASAARVSSNGCARIAKRQVNVFTDSAKALAWYQTCSGFVTDRKMRIPIEQRNTAAYTPK